MFGKKNKFLRAVKSVEKALMADRLTEAESEILVLKQEFPDYAQADLGYLVDYFHAQAIFRRENLSETPNQERVEEGISLLESSIKLNERYADAHFLLGLNYILKISIPSREHGPSGEPNSRGAEKALIHLNLATSYNPSYLSYIKY